MPEVLHENTWLAWLAKVRVIVITFLFGIELAVAVLTPTNLPKGVFVMVVLLWYTISVLFLLLTSAWRDDHGLQPPLQVLTDMVMATAFVYVTGGIDSSFNFLYPLLIIVASVLLPRAWTFMVAGLCFILSGGMLELAYFGIIPSFSAGRLDLRSLQATILINLLAYMAIAYLSSHLSHKLRQADVQLQFKSGALESLQALHENIIQSMSGGLITTGLDGRVTLINAAGQRLLGKFESEIVGRPVEQLFVDPLPLPGPAPIRLEMRVSLSGRQRTLGLTRSALSVPDRGEVGFVYTFDDLTEIRRLEREVRLRDRLSAVGRMAAAIAHEIRNPLASIAGSVKVLADVSVLDAEQHTLVDIVTRESERLNNIISDFLAYSREKHFQLVDSDLVPLLDDTLMLLRNRAEFSPEADDKSRIEVLRRFDVSSARAAVDSDRIKQVFWNICENAVRAMAERGGTLTVSLRADRDYWLISFADTGAGLSPQQMEKIFEPFQSSFVGGTGLGLALVYQIVQAHDGKIAVRSSEGNGAEFVVRLRRSDAARPLPETAVAAAAGRGPRG